VVVAVQINQTVEDLQPQVRVVVAQDTLVAMVCLLLITTLLQKQVTVAQRLAAVVVVVNKADMKIIGELVAMVVPESSSSHTLHKYSKNLQCQRQETYQDLVMSVESENQPQQEIQEHCLLL
jgi:hypothetical protein